MFVFSGSSNRKLAESIAKFIGVPLGDAAIERFPDGEVFVKIKENIRGHDVFFVQSICNTPNESLMELLIMIDAARRSSAKRITAVIPYYGYARQDRKDQPRVPITAKLVANLLVAAGTNRLLTMDLHAQQIQGFFDIPVDHLYAAPVLQKHLKSKHISDLTVVSPDPGGLKMAYAYSKIMGAGLAIVAKQRKTASEVEAISVVGEVEGCNCVLVDDMTTTAGTLSQAATLLKANGAKSVSAAVSHCLLTEVGSQRICKSPIAALVPTDTVPARQWENCPITVLSVADLLGEAIMRIHNNQSVTSLFRV